MRISPTLIEGVMVIDTVTRRDARGGFTRLFCVEELAAVLNGRQIVQINHSLTTLRGTVRGMHLQRPPHAEMKLVRCLKGRIFDVAVDLRAGSTSLCRWHGEELSADNGRILAIPEGCAHGFQTLEADCELLYLHTRAYAPAAEVGVDCRDPALAIAWPLPVAGRSTRDTQHVPLPSRFEGIEL